MPIYLDYLSTTPCDPKVVDAMTACLLPEGNFGNPASRSHLFGWRAEEAVEVARGQVADLIGAQSREIVWTSGATESDNLAIKGAVHRYADRGRHIVTSAIEHKAVLDSCAQLELEGFEVTYLSPTPSGIITPEAVAAAIREDTVLVSIMHVNNELGVINDVAAIGAVCQTHQALFHVDAAQSAGKIAIDVNAMHIDLLSMSAHKLYGPKGVGALYVRRNPRIQLEAQIHGGGHEQGLRSGTLATHQLVGMGCAAELAATTMVDEAARISRLRDRLWAGLEGLPAVAVNGDLARQIPGALNVRFGYVEGEALVMSLSNLALSTGSACTSASLEPSYVLKAIGLSDELAHSSLRFCVGRFTTEAEIDTAIADTRQALQRLRDLSPQWRADFSKQSE